jgi:hypothetical protein
MGRWFEDGLEKVRVALPRMLGEVWGESQAYGDGNDSSESVQLT